jgi:galactokinase
MTTTLEQSTEEARRQFHARFGRAPRWIVAAPGRVNIIGEHVDYNDGFVLPMAIDRYCVIAAGESAQMSPLAKVASTAEEDAVEISLTSPARRPSGHWSNYVAGVVAGGLARGMRPAAFEAMIHSTVPYGGGLSSSAALEVATATLLEAMTGVQLPLVEKALLCQRAEHEYAGVPCGIMDQFASTMCRPDHLMLLDCRSRAIEQIPLVDPNVAVLIINTNVKHELTGGEYAERRGQCEAAAKKLGVNSLRDATLEMLEASRRALTDVEYRRARHAISEIARTTLTAAAIKAGDWQMAGKLMYESHASLRDDFEVSCPELDLLVTLAQEIGPAIGVFGARMTGGGFGGCTVSLVETGRVAAIAEKMSTQYERQTGIPPTVLTSRPARGAHVVEA